MSDRHLAHWPPGLSRHLTLPQTHLFHNAEVSAARYPDKPFLVFYDTLVTFRQFQQQAEHIAGFLQQVCGVKAGDRVLLYMQNSPQWILAFYGILRANAVVVPVNPMNLTDELRHYVQDSGATVAFVPQDLHAQAQPLVDVTGGESGGGKLRHLIVAAYSDYLQVPTDLPVPAFVSAPRQAIDAPGVTLWSDMLAQQRTPGPITTGPDDLCVMPYTSGTTGHPKGCMHTHRSAMSTLVGGVQWFARTQDSTYLTVLPLFHVTGMSGSMNGPLFVGATVVVLPRWDRDAAAQLIQRYRVTIWQAISTMVVDFLANPRIADYDISSLQAMRGGGAAMPKAVAQRLKDLTGLDYVEGYGMSETMAATHINPPHRPKPQCLGIPVFDVDSRVVDPATFTELPPGEIGEIVVHGPQVMLGYWNNPQASADSFVMLDGKRFLRTGDLAQVDEDGYFFMVDRLKRMINASGFKVWPAEVEAMMYAHPAIQEVCVIAAHDERRGETVKALVVLRDAFKGQVSEQSIIDWSHEHMAAYKSPRIVQLVDSLPKSGTGKVQWRELQEQERSRAAGAAS
ncbi:long-chain fatty acid--CoA ligase [Acidovorax sp. D2M1]|uniref:Long-chain fatty acid--CoA ligase n=1 Tax=Acidovorax benzenivorans TaxID=2987520 RepID=A0ABT5RQF0_9BURK|nr:long-chain fatty acid--CoA ligase [Acidovorax benzenivorans]MDD2175925.1 long-chain fatty acid--CoA ligase [Acidovorax benzenivorans]